MQKDTKIKIDFNLLQSGTWVLERKGKRKIHKFEKRVGDGKIVIYNALEVPSPKDSKVLDFLIRLSQENDWSEEVMLPSLSEALRELRVKKSKNSVEQFLHSLDVLVNTRIEFHNCFIDSGILKHFGSGNWKKISIGILSDYGLVGSYKRGKPIKLKVVFNPNFITLCKYSLGYKLIPYAPIQGLRDTAYALYKWAYRWYDSAKGYGERWIGNGKSLVDWYRNELNSAAKYKYPSEVIRRLKSALSQLNAHPQVPFYITLAKRGEGYKLEICKKKGNESFWERIPLYLREAVCEFLKRNRGIQNVNFFVHSLTEEELKVILERLVIIFLPRDAWDILAFSLASNRSEEKDFKDSILFITEEAEESSRVALVIEEVNLRKKKIITKLLDIVCPKWIETCCNALDLVEKKFSHV